MPDVARAALAPDDPGNALEAVDLAGRHAQAAAAWHEPEGEDS
jgi:hypothetical protein